jgi:hypothetical protein
MAQKLAFLDEAQTWSGVQTHTAAVALNGATTLGGATTVGATGGTVGFYGLAPAAIRAQTSIHNTSAVSAYTSTTASALIGAWIIEVTNTLNGLGIWQG